jgi:hypothetical protein
MSEDIEGLGPIDYMVVEFPGDRFTGKAFPMLEDLVTRRLVTVYDLVLFSKGEDGTVTRLEPSQVPVQGDVDMSAYDGVSSGLLSDEDVREAAEAVLPGTIAGVLIYENTWAAPFATALREAGGQLVASQRIPVQAVLAVLDEIDAAEQA